MRRVYIAWLHSLFHRSVCLLLDHPGVQIIGASQDMATAQTELETLRPDTIIVEKPEDESPANAEALQIIKTSGWNPRVIYASLENNTVWIYQREQRTLEEAEDLLHLILDE